MWSAKCEKQIRESRLLSSTNFFSSIGLMSNPGQGHNKLAPVLLRLFTPAHPQVVPSWAQALVWCSHETPLQQHSCCCGGWQFINMSIGRAIFLACVPLRQLPHQWPRPLADLAQVLSAQGPHKIVLLICFWKEKGNKYMLNSLPFIMGIGEIYISQ